MYEHFSRQATSEESHDAPTLLDKIYAPGACDTPEARIIIMAEWNRLGPAERLQRQLDAAMVAPNPQSQATYTRQILLFDAYNRVAA